MTAHRLSLVALAVLCAAASAQAGALDNIKSTGKIRLGYRGDARPFSYEEGGHADGYSVALCDKIVAALKVELPATSSVAVEWVKVDTEDRFEAVESGKIDLLCGAATLTLERRKKIAFSIPIFASGISALVRADAPERLQAVLEGREPEFRARWRANLAQVLEKRVLTAQKGTTAATWLAKRADDLEVKADLQDVSSYKEGIDRVLAGTSDAFFADRAILLDEAARNPKAGDLHVLERLYTYEPIALVMARNDDDFRLFVDRTLSNVYRTGGVWELYKKYFGKSDENAQTFFRLATQPE